jgi:hypothetical protein
VKILFNDGNERVGRRCTPDLRLDCILTSTQKVLDAQVPLSAFEEDLGLPAIFL